MYADGCRGTRQGEHVRLLWYGCMECTFVCLMVECVNTGHTWTSRANYAAHTLSFEIHAEHC